MDINARFEQAVANMEKINNYLAAEVCKLGYPVLTDTIPTACVGWDENKKKVIFWFNPEFAKTLTDDEFCFVVAHEGIHLVNSHVFLIYNEMDKMKRQKKSQSEMGIFMRKMNVAMDCVVNDSLVNLYNFPKILEGDPNDPTKIKVFYGIPTVGVDCEDLTAQEVFYMLPEGDAGNSILDAWDQIDNHDVWKSFFDDNGNFKKDFVDAIKDLVNKNVQNSAFTDQELKQIQDIKKAMQDCNDGYVSRAGKDANGNKRPVDGSDRRALNWNKILYKFVETLKPEDIWSKPNRKLIPSYPDIILPSWKDQEKEKIFCAVDVSGSINYDALKLFISVLRNTPKRFEIEAITFNTSCYEYDIFGKNMPEAGGGTDFAIIERYIQDNCKKYPKAVFILTDGWGTPVKPEYPNRWGWLLYGHSSREYCKNMKAYNIMDILVERR